VKKRLDFYVKNNKKRTTMQQQDELAAICGKSASSWKTTLGKREEKLNDKTGKFSKQAKDDLRAVMAVYKGAKKWSVLTKKEKESSENRKGYLREHGKKQSRHENRQTAIV